MFLKERWSWRAVWGVASVILSLVAEARGGHETVYPGANWQTRRPEEVGLVRGKLDELARLVRGRGCVVRHGYLVYSWGDVSQSADVASAVKPVISTLLLLAVQEGRIKSVDDRVAEFEPRLRTLNGGKDGGITWRQLASQTSGYGLAEPPGGAYSYNDYALALYYDVLTTKVFGEDGTSVLKGRLGDALGFQDPYTFQAFRSAERAGRLAISVRDFARFGLLYLRRGRWGDKQVLRPELIDMALRSPVAADTPVSAGQDSEMLFGQRTLGGGKRITTVGPGYYSFNWWLNGRDRKGRRLFVDAPEDAYVATGHGGPRMLWVIPSLDLVASWNDAEVEDHDSSPGHPGTKCNRAARLMREAATSAGGEAVRGRQTLENEKPATQGRSTPAGRTRVSIVGDKWHLNGSVTYPGARTEGLLMNVRMVNAVFEDQKRPEFDAEANTEEFVARIPEYVAHGLRAFTICLQGGTPGYEGAVNSVFEADGSLRPEYMRRVERVIRACDAAGAVVILGYFYQRQDQILRDEEAVRAGVVNVARWIRERRFTNVVLEIANEFGHGGFDHKLLRTAEGQVELVRLVKEAAPGLLVSTSSGGSGTVPESVCRASDVVLVHFNSTPVEAIPARIAALKKYGKPVVCNEDAKGGEEGARAAEACVESGASWGLMVERVNQWYPFEFRGVGDDRVVYGKLKELTTAR